MSTKSTLAHGDNFHFYKDYCDNDDSVNLQITSNCSCKHSHHINIPPEIWECIRQVPAINFEFIDKTDDDILKLVEEEVDERLKDYNAATTEREKAFCALFASAIYGDPDDPRDTQIQEGVSYYTNKRNKELQIKEKMKEFKVYLDYYND
jgi:hypothetical protein